MAKFSCDLSSIELDDGRHGGDHGSVSGSSFFSELTADELLSVLRPAAEALKRRYQETILRLFKRRSGSLVESIQLDEDKFENNLKELNEAIIIVGPKGKHKKGKRAARSRAGSSDQKYAKHNREAKATAISNAELAYLLEFGTPRIAATHWMENTNEAVEDEIQGILDDGFTEVLKKKGLI